VLCDGGLFGEAHEAMVMAAGRIDGHKAAPNLARATLQYSAFLALRGGGVDAAESRRCLDASAGSVCAALAALREVGSCDEATECITLLTLSWRTMMKLPSFVDPLLIGDRTWFAVLGTGLEQFADLGAYVLGHCAALRLRDTLEGWLLAAVVETEKLQPHILSSIIDALTKAATLYSSVISGLAPSIEPSMRCLGRAEECSVDPAHFRRVSHGFSLLGRVLSDLGLPKDAAAPLQRACAILEELVEAEQSTDSRVELLEESKLSHRLVALGNVYMQGGDQLSGLRAFRHAVCRSPDVAKSCSSFSLVERFVRAQFRGEANGYLERLDRPPGGPPAPRFMEVQGSDALCASRGFLAVSTAAEAMGLPGSVVAMDELRAQFVVLEEHIKVRGGLSQALLDSLLAYHEHTLGEIVSAATEDCDLWRCAALVESARFCHHAARASLSTDLLGRIVRDVSGQDRASVAQFEEFGRAADAPETPSSACAPPTKGPNGGPPSASLISTATTRLSEALATLRRVGSKGCHSSRAISVELSQAHLVSGLLRRGQGGQGEGPEDHFEAALCALSVAVGDRGEAMDCSCRCMIGHEARIACTARSLCDHFSTTGETWKQVIYSGTYPLDAHVMESPLPLGWPVI
jgi:hypothetical protein